ncbi:MAG: 30S ribosomal protein S17e [Candidatus Nanoarchaeia archaeon]|nr:30S ribosomal protein S17e [Candidatus Nanoarchaeia archaeon]
MGRIRTSFIKKVGKQIYTKNKPEITKNFEQNKVTVSKIADIPSKQLRNRLAGYVTMLAKKEKR